MSLLATSVRFRRTIPLIIILLLTAVACGGGAASPAKPAWDDSDGKEDSASAASTRFVVGTVVDTMSGELDPIIWGDICITYVQTDAGLVGLIEKFDPCENANAWSSKIGAAVRYPASKARKVRSGQKLAALRHYDSRIDRADITYFYFYGTLEAVAGAPATGCAFGDDWALITRASSPVYRSNERVITEADERSLSAVDGQRIKRAVVVRYPEARDAENLGEVLASVEDGKVTLVHLWDKLGARRFVAVEFNPGEGVYGAIFPATTSDAVATIEASGIPTCDVPVETCLFGSTYGDIRRTGRFRILSEKTTDAPASLSALEGSQALTAVVDGAGYDDVSTLAQAFAAVDDSTMSFVTFETLAGRRFTAVDFATGDNTYGAIFAAGTATMVSAIHDGDFFDCAAFLP